MFRPSQNLLLRAIPAVNKIHHPLPLSPRESTQLLNILKASFRQHLDAEHPQFSPRAEHAARPSSQSSTSPRRGRSSSDPAHPADRHLHSLLTNPLFGLLDRPRGRSIMDPMVTFDQAVAKGMMTARYAHACLYAVKRGIIDSSVLDVRDGMKASGAGLKVLKWLVSSGTANNNEFLRDERFSGLLMEFMVAEGLQEAAWAWVKRALEGGPELSKLPWSEARQKAREDATKPLELLVKAEATGPVSLDAAYLCLSRAAGYLKGRSALEMRPYLGRVVWYLVKATIFHTHQPSSESNFESFLSLIPGLSKHTDYQFAHLNVLHPTKPSAELALDFLRELDVTSPSESTQKLVTEEKITHCHYQLKLSLDTAKLLLETNRFLEAEWVMDFARTRFPKQLGVKEKLQLEEAKAEALSLELLEGLNLA